MDATQTRARFSEQQQSPRRRSRTARADVSSPSVRIKRSASVSGDAYLSVETAKKRRSGAVVHVITPESDGDDDELSRQEPTQLSTSDDTTIRLRSPIRKGNQDTSSPHASEPTMDDFMCSVSAPSAQEHLPTHADNQPPLHTTTMRHDPKAEEAAVVMEKHLLMLEDRLAQHYSVLGTSINRREINLIIVTGAGADLEKSRLDYTSVAAFLTHSAAFNAPSSKFIDEILAESRTKLDQLDEVMQAATAKWEEAVRDQESSGNLYNECKGKFDSLVEESSAIAKRLKEPLKELERTLELCTTRHLE